MTVAFAFDGSSPVVPRDAATVLVLREGKDGPEVFFVCRNASASFMGGAYVFPGGRLDPEDLHPDVPCDLDADEAARRLGEPDAWRARGLYVAALRECLEESGIASSGPRCSFTRAHWAGASYGRGHLRGQCAYALRALDHPEARDPSL